MSEHITSNVADGILTLSFNRPEKKNAITGTIPDVVTNVVTLASGGGGQPRGQLDFYDRPGRKADERARREHRARPRGLNPRPATDRPSGHRQPSGGGHITHRPEHAGGRGRLTRPRRAPGPDRPGSGVQARHHAPVKPRRHREKARSERGRNRHGTPPRQASRREAARPLGPPGPAPRASPR